MNDQSPMRILFVCMGNICRSPTAEGVLRHRHARRGALPPIEVDSAGTHGYHVGDPPDPRSVEAAARRGIDLSGLRARQLTRGDFAAFDLVLAMDERNLRDATRIAPPAVANLKLYLEYAPALVEREVPDPYYEEDAAFERVLDLCEAAAEGLLDTLGATHPRR